MEMELVETLEEIRNNMRTLDRYLNSKREPEYSYALSRIKKGTCFIADNSSGAYRFYPSRFIGYVNNTMNLHENNFYKRGTDTNREISKILGKNPCANVELEGAYREYCRRLGFEPNQTGSFGRPRQYWKLD